MAGGAGGPPPSTLSQELIVAALLELDERPDVALPAGLREVGSMSGARGIAAGQDATVGEKRLEGRGVTVVALLASDDVAPVSRRFPVVGVLRDRVGLRVGDVAVGAAVPLSPEGSRTDDNEKKQPHAKAHLKFLQRSKVNKPPAAIPRRRRAERLPGTARRGESFPSCCAEGSSYTSVTSRSENEQSKPGKWRRGPRGWQSSRKTPNPPSCGRRRRSRCGRPPLAPPSSESPGRATL